MSSDLPGAVIGDGHRLHQTQRLEGALWSVRLPCMGKPLPWEIRNLHVPAIKNQDVKMRTNRHRPAMRTIIFHTTKDLGLCKKTRAPNRFLNSPIEDE